MHDQMVEWSCFNILAKMSFQKYFIFLILISYRYMQPDLVDGELYLAPNFPAPPNTDYQGYHNYIDEIMPPESPYLYGLHPNAEIGFLTTTSENLFRTVFEMQPR